MSNSCEKCFELKNELHRLAEALKKNHTCTWQCAPCPVAEALAQSPRSLALVEVELLEKRLVSRLARVPKQFLPAQILEALDALAEAKRKAGVG